MSDMRLTQVYAERDTDDFDNEIVFDERYEGPRFTGYNEEFYRLIEEAEEDRLAGRVYTNDDFFDDILRSIDDGTI